LQKAHQNSGIKTAFKCQIKGTVCDFEEILHGEANQKQLQDRKNTSAVIIILEIPEVACTFSVKTVPMFSAV